MTQVPYPAFEGPREDPVYSRKVLIPRDFMRVIERYDLIDEQNLILEEAVEQEVARRIEAGDKRPPELIRALLLDGRQRGPAYRKARENQRSANQAQRRRAQKIGTTVEEFTREQIIERDKSTCHICGKVCALNEIHIDHIVPLSRGGTHTVDNVAVACAPCNLRKGATLPA